MVLGVIACTVVIYRYIHYIILVISGGEMMIIEKMKTSILCVEMEKHLSVHLNWISGPIGFKHIGTSVISPGTERYLAY